MKSPLRILPSLVLIVACCVFASCKDRNSIRTYRASKEEAPKTAEDPHIPMGMPPMMQGGSDQSGSKAGCPMTGSADQSSITTDVPPKGWEKQAPASMRQASYLAKGKEGAQADISLIILGGAAGGPLDNVNRWLSQLGQVAVTQEQLLKMARTVSAPMGQVTVVDLQGKPEGGNPSKDGRILAGMVGVDGATWFFKMRGNAEVVGAQKEAFLQWIASVKRASGPPSPGATQETSASAQRNQGSTEQPKISWNQPKEWQPSQGSSMRYASFSAKGYNGKNADISVSFLPGQAGTDLDNVNRWRSQVGLPPIAGTDMPGAVIPVTCKDGSFSMVELDGASTKMLVAWTRVDGNTWFFKLTAPAPLADKQKQAFKSFLQSVTFHPRAA